jgi:hypothetical protein
MYLQTQLRKQQITPLNSQKTFTSYEKMKKTIIPLSL